MFTKGHCSPRNKNIKHSCLSKDILIKIAKLLNKKYDAKIKIKKTKKDKLFKEITEVMNKNSECKTESCWLNINKIMDGLSSKEKKEIEESFRPEKPDEWKNNPNTWLSTEDINNVMKQYENEFSHFKFFGATPIDFNLKSGNTCMISDLCNININLDKLSDKKCIGMVFNTDPHTEGGQHWFSMYVDKEGINMPNPAIYYFDSANPVQKFEEIPEQILELIYKLEEQFNFNFDIYFNDIKHQKGNTECGVYCLHFLTEMLKGKNFYDYIASNLTDKKIETFRDIFFRK